MREKSCFYMEYNLQWFAKEGNGGEKTEPATSKKLQDARNGLGRHLPSNLDNIRQQCNRIPN